jgi:outer membrane receptor for ferrienterochelin and colicins
MWLAAVAARLPAQATGAESEQLFLGEIPSVFGASRFDQSVTDAPASVTVIPAEEIAAFGWRTLADVLRSVRGLHVTNDRSYPQVALRGFGVPGDFNIRMLLLVDGVRQNENVYDGAYMTSMIVDPTLIERVEVIRGPASSLYGTNALLGIVNVVTRRGRARQGAQMAASVERFGTRDVSLSGGTRLARGLEIVGSTQLYRSAGRDFYFPDLDDPATANGQVRGADGEQREQLFGKASWGPATLQVSSNLRRKALPTATYGTTVGDVRQRFEDNLHSVSLQLQPRLNEQTDLMVLASTHRYDFNGRYPYSDGVSAEQARGRWSILDAQLGRVVAGRHRVQAGAAYYANHRQELRWGADTGMTVRNRATADVWAVFAQSDIRIGNRVTITSGVRRDQVAGRPATVTPRAAIVSKFGSASALKLLYGTAFRAPNINERFNDDDGVSSLANPTLRPERIETYEVLLEHVLSRSVKGTFSAYHFDTRDLIAPATVDTLEQYQNIGRATGRGIEAELAIDRGTVSGRLSYAAQRSRDARTGSVMPNSPTHLGTLNVTMPTPTRHARLALEARALSERRDVLGERVPAAVVANVILSTVRRTRGPLATLAIYNVLNTQYDDPVSLAAATMRVRQDPVAARLTLGWGF